MKHDIVTLRCDDGAEVVTFNKYTSTKLLCGDDRDEIVKDISYEINVEDSFVGGCYRGFFGRIKRAWDAFWARPVYYSGIYTDDKEKMKKFLTDSLSLLENKSHMSSSQAINLLFHIANNISLITDVEEDQEVYLQAIEKAVEALTKNQENE